jgi:hypothetical protein
MPIVDRSISPRLEATMYHFNTAPPASSVNRFQGQCRTDSSQAVDRASGPAASTFRTTMHPDGSATTETDAYLFTVRPGNAQTGGTFTIFNKKTGKQQEHIWGDPHSSAGEFHGTLTLLLDGGIKASLQTSRFGNTNSTLLDAVTLTDGNEGVRMAGVSSGALTVQQGNGRMLDRWVPDGMTAYSTPDGMRGEHGEVVNQTWLNTHDMQLNPWLQGKPDAEWQDASGRGPDSFGLRQRHFGHGMDAEMHRHLNDYLGRLPSLDIESIEMDGGFTRLTHMPPQRYCYQNSVGWSVQSRHSPFGFLQAR